MAVVSTVPTLKARLVTVLAARAGLTGVSVTYSWPGPSLPSGAAAVEAIFLGDVKNESRIPNIRAGRKVRDEQYTLDVVFWVIEAGGSADAAATTEARAYALLGELDGALADDVQLGIPTVIQWAQLTDHTVEHAPAGKGWACQIVATVEVHARLA